jgi:hypothetical protein
MREYAVALVNKLTRAAAQATPRTYVDKVSKAMAGIGKELPRVRREIARQYPHLTDQQVAAAVFRATAISLSLVADSISPYKPEEPRDAA